MKVSEIKTITKNKFESLKELISVLSNGEVTVYKENRPVHFNGTEIYFEEGKYATKTVKIKAEDADYKQFYTLYTNITTY